MTVHPLQMQLSAALMRFASLQRRAAAKVNPAIVSTLIMELEHSLHEVETACDELKTQSDRLAEERDTIASLERRYRELFEFAPVPYIITDEHGTVTSANRAASVLLNVTARFLTGKPLALFIGGHRPEFMDSLSAIASATEPVEQRLLIKPRERASVHVTAVARVTVDAGAPALWWVLLRENGGDARVQGAPFTIDSLTSPDPQSDVVSTED